MADPYPPVERWVVPLSGLEATVEAVGPSRLDGLESGVFWMGRRSAVGIVESVIIPKGPGVERRRDCWRVSADVFAAISRWALPREVSLLGWVHTHGRGIPPKLSMADRMRSIRAPGVLAIVIGSGGADSEPDQWGWFVHEDGEYRFFEGVERARRVELHAEGAIDRWRANLDGVVEEFG